MVIEIKDIQSIIDSIEVDDRKIALETKSAKCRDAKIGIVTADETKEKLRNLNKGKPVGPMSAERKEKIGNANRGRKLKGPSQETRDKLSKHTKYVYITPKGTFDTRKKMLDAYEGELTMGDIGYRIRIGKDGFKKVKK